MNKLAMSLQLLSPILVYLLVGVAFADSSDPGFTYNGFQSANLSLDGLAQFSANGLLRLINNTKSETGHAFYPNPIHFKNTSNGSAFSFSTTFVFAIVSSVKSVCSDGMAFVIAPQKGLPGAMALWYLGLFNSSNSGNETNHVFAVELDTIQSPGLGDINDNHVGIDINGLTSANSTQAGYYVDKNGLFRNLSLISGHPMQLWVEYDGKSKEISITLAKFKSPKPKIPLMKSPYDLSPILKEIMFVGFSSATGPIECSYYVLGWSFRVNGVAQELDLSVLPKPPWVGPKRPSKWLTIGLPLMCTSLVLVTILAVIYLVSRKRKFAEVLEDWEVAYGPHRFKYKDLYSAAKGFKDKELLGVGGFGRVYKGILPTTKIEVAIKRVSHDSRQGMREFVAEIASIGRMRHRNLVPLLGYCRRKGELLLVYEFMPNGSLDKFLYDQPNFTLNWSQRFRIIKGVASGLFYLHEGWEKVVIHRDVKASNVLLDGDLNGRLGDFGLARLYDHGANPQTTRVVGTLGYLAPEHARNGRSSTSTDVYAFGAFLLEVVCGRRPIEPAAPAETPILVDLVFSSWRNGKILQVVDQNLDGDYVKEEVELVLNLGLLCSYPEPTVRPSMHQVVQYLEGSLPIPELSSLGISPSGLAFAHRHGFGDVSMSYSYTTSMGMASSQSSYVAESLLSGGR